MRVSRPAVQSPWRVCLEPNTSHYANLSSFTSGAYLEVHRQSRAAEK